MESVIELVVRPDGSTGLGNSIELPREEAIERIKTKTAKHESYAIGQVPDEWQSLKKSNKKKYQPEITEDAEVSEDESNS